METKLRFRREWYGTSPEGLSFEIAHWGEGEMCDGHGMWNYYVIIHEDQLRPDDWAKVWLPVESRWKRSDGHEDPSYNEWSSVLYDGDFHGGVTLYEKHQQVDGDRRRIKVGCDYGHSWDRDVGYGYTLEMVTRDALNTCAKLAAILNPLARCTWSGHYFDARFDVSDLVSGWKGGHLSPAGLGSRSAYQRKRFEEALEAAS